MPLSSRDQSGDAVDEVPSTSSTSETLSPCSGGSVHGRKNLVQSPRAAGGIFFVDNKIQTVIQRVTKPTELVFSQPRRVFLGAGLGLTSAELSASLREFLLPLS